MRLRPNRRTERAGINATRAFFEGCNCVFQEVDLGNDYGKDAYVDLVDGREVTGVCVALQIKSGHSYRLGAGYVIPIEGHADIWRRSTVPVAGVVYDPDSSALYWCDISSFLVEHRDNLPTHVPVSRDQLLTPESLEAVFKPVFSRLVAERVAGLAILQVASCDEEVQGAALQDCFAAGRSDPKVLILLRYLLPMLGGVPLRMALSILAHTTPHPDIFWCKSNWVPEDVCAAVRQHFVWNKDEITLFLSDVSWEEWQRGDVGQDVYMLLREDPGIEAKMEHTAVEAIREGKDSAAWAALYLAVYWAGTGGSEKYDQLIRAAPQLRDLRMSAEIEFLLGQNGYVSLFE